MQVLSVTDVNRYLKLLLGGDPVLGDVWIAGEVSSLTRSATGHTYWTMKDAGAQLRCVLFRRESLWQSFRPENGMAILAHGRIDVYEGAGAYQLYVDMLEHQGQGLLYLEFEQLKRKLENEGLFATERKRPLPPRPHRIGLVTSPTGAVLHDVIDVLTRRSPWVELVLSPALVQGNEAASSICRALELLFQQDVDVIIVARGGGSIEDLSCFNDELVARVVAASPMPLVSGIGHETDFTICDFVADVRAATPSVAAEIVSPSIDEDQAALENARQLLERSILDTLDERRDELKQSQRALLGRSPHAQISVQRQRIDDLLDRAAYRVRARMERARMELEHQRRQLTLVHPTSVLDRGYAIVRDRASSILITSTTQVVVGQALDIVVHDGTFGTVVDAAS